RLRGVPAAFRDPVPGRHRLGALARSRGNAPAAGPLRLRRWSRLGRHVRRHQGRLDLLHVASAGDGAPPPGAPKDGRVRAQVEHAHPRGAWRAALRSRRTRARARSSAEWSRRATFPGRAAAGVRGAVRAAPHEPVRQASRSGGRDPPGGDGARAHRPGPDRALAQHLESPSGQARGIASRDAVDGRCGVRSPGELTGEALAATDSPSQLRAFDQEAGSMFEREPSAGEVLTDAALGALAGAAATAVMTPLTTYLSRHDPEPSQRKEQEVSRRFGDPPSVKVAEKLAGAVGASIPPERRSLAGGGVRYGFGTFWGACLGGAARRWTPPPPGAGVALGILLWLSVDEGAL